ncbi:MAG: hypothetical protein HY832_03460 [Candidatus Aenigmarchaeota archaeon]|nr:hypothetical protein [Candidatus Aenigmarchaeota archaeon]
MKEDRTVTTYSVILVLLLLLFLLTNENVVNSANFYTSAFVISPILITFIVGFYKLAVEKQIQDKIEQIIFNKWKTEINQISNQLKLVSTEIEKNRPDFKKLETLTGNIGESFSIFTRFISKYQIGNKIAYGILPLIIGLLIAFVNNLYPRPFMFNAFNSNTIVYACIIAGFYAAIVLVLIWRDIVNDSKSV